MSWFGAGKAEDVGTLMARRQYDKAREVLESELRQDPKSVHLRQHYADVLVQMGEGEKAVGVLRSLVDQFAADGFVAKAIAVLKKIQRIEPGRAEVDERLAALLQGGRGPAAAGAPSPAPTPAPAPATAPAAAASAAPEPPPPAGPSTSIPPPPDPLRPTAEVVISEQWVEAAPENRDGFRISPLFADFSRQELAAVVGGLSLISKGPGSIILTEGEPGDSFYILTTGVARVYRKNETGHNYQVATLREGDFFGEAALLTGEPRSATITTATECELLLLDRDTFRSLVTTYPRVAELIRELHAHRAGRRNGGGG